ncbi:MAG: extracellular solute-binding protein [Rhodospirillales bacterium]|nr:extracellular solute-binding protein [Rhodospirillales bacterium]MDP6804416.1 extracellular solute-binding protein [Rhodospirillales bacterium]
MAGTVARVGTALVIAALAPTGAAGEEKVHVSHAMAMHGEAKYGPAFKHFDYVNPVAPKGGEVRLGVQGTFDSFNPYIIKGVPGAGSAIESLTASSADEAFTEYGLIAETIEWPEDRSWVAFRLRKEARWHDGQPITADDVIFSFETLKAKGRPFFRFYYGSIEKAEKLGPRRVRFVFAPQIDRGLPQTAGQPSILPAECRERFAAGPQINRELPLIVGQLPILPKHYWESRDFEKTTLEPPLGSGPYRIVDFEPGRYVVIERVEDYWGKDLAVKRGQNNFDRIRYDYYRDPTVIRLALKAGQIDYREENQAKAWAVDYDVPRVREGWLKLEEVPHQRPTGMQAFVMNVRRPVFADARVRRALAYAFDFEWSNRNLFFSQYARTESYFSNSELASSGLPAGEEKEILDCFRGRIPDEVPSEVYAVPATDGSGWPRANLRQAFAMLAEAGWVVRDSKLVNAETGEGMRFEILLVSPAFERIVLPFKRNLGRLGIDVRVRLVDRSQYINRLREFDFDVIVSGWGQSDSPGNEQRDFWGSAAANSPGGRNYAGVSNPVVDELIELIIAAPDRDSLIARTRALDRVLLWGHYVIPQWHARNQRIAYWNKFARPALTPKDGTSLSYWWIDPVKASALDARKESEPLAEAREQSDRPGTMIVLAVFSGLLALGYVVFRRVLRRGSIG